MDNLIICTEKLIIILDRLKQQFEKNFAANEQPGKGREFFQMVKKETEPVFDLLERWEKESLQVISLGKSTLHPQQITSTKENMEALLLHSYYLDVRKRRYMEMYKSCFYIFSQMLKEMHDERETHTKSNKG